MLTLDFCLPQDLIVYIWPIANKTNGHGENDFLQNKNAYLLLI